MPAGVYHSDGSIRVTVVDGLTRVGTYAADGSWNVIEAPGPATTKVGVYHSCGARYVTLQAVAVSSIYAPDGSLNVSVTPYVSGTQKVTVVAGAF